ncbi:hypothetical protein Q5P01_013986 [Channa striata]|uniref:Uncharacterized protein n=1 Tax=Channa striata TaxID=64152 RepID=A0AA88MLI0_CHASR|nr:hypothetical protein Q5P01_013986 [Channa striata]
MKRSRNAEMTASSFSIIITIYLSVSFHLSYGFKVIQPENRTVDPDGLVSISCEHNANVTSVTDVRLSSVSKKDGKKTLLCQKEKPDCENTLMLSNNPQKWLFILLNVGPEAIMNMVYECEFTLNENNLHETKKGQPTKLLQGRQEKDCAPPSPLPPASQSDRLKWILIGLLALLFLCICVIVCFYVKLRKSKEDPENCLYVEMRKAPLPRQV